MIQIYAVNISQSERLYDSLYEKASLERRLRADRCHSRKSAMECLASEALLRYGLRTVYGIEQYSVEANPYGKPRLAEFSDVHFNLSHSGPWVVLALGSSAVGIDVQTAREAGREEAVAHRFFSQAEQQFVFQSEQDREKRFLQIWTMKESFLKYLGTGLKKPLTSFCVCSMEDPCFFTNWLEDDCLCLCTQEPEYHLEIIPAENLL